jgi:hypothetical protein
VYLNATLEKAKNLINNNLIDVKALPFYQSEYNYPVIQLIWAD